MVNPKLDQLGVHGYLAICSVVTCRAIRLHTFDGIRDCNVDYCIESPLHYNHSNFVLEGQAIRT